MPPFEKGAAELFPPTAPPAPKIVSPEGNIASTAEPFEPFDRIYSQPEAPLTEREELRRAIYNLRDADPDDAAVLPDLRLVLEMFHPATEATSVGGRGPIARMHEGKYTHHRVERTPLLAKNRMREDARDALEHFVQSRYPEMAPREGREHGVPDHKYNYHITAEAELLRLQLELLGNPDDALDPRLAALEGRFLQVVDLAIFGIGRIPTSVKKLIADCRSHEGQRILTHERQVQAEAEERRKSRQEMLRHPAEAVLRLWHR